MMKLETGKLLISDPFLKDPNFKRSVIFICNYEKEGCFGFVLNKQYSKNLNELIQEIGTIHFPVFYGGPVQVDTLHFLHTKPNLINGGIKVNEEIFWGGNFEQVISLIKNNEISPRDIRFYIGYSGWSEGQLDAEIDQKSWIIHHAKKKFIFNLNDETLWKEVLTDLGGEYKMLINYPLDPQFN